MRNILSIYTKRVNLAESPAVRWWGLAGARRFWLGWAAFMYTFLAVISGFLLSVIVPSSDDRAARFLPYVAVVLIILAAALLTRMLMRVLAELHGLESLARRDRDTK